jgi:hypothetical protein
MIGEDWIEKVRQYRLAVHAYCDAVDRIASTGDLGQEWQQIEVARDEAERVRSALLREKRESSFTNTRGLVSANGSDYETEELVLGDLGQLGG